MCKTGIYQILILSHNGMASIKKKFSLHIIGTVRPVLEYGAACWDPCREGQINALYREQTKAAQFTYHKKDSDWETLVQHRMIARLCAHFKAYFVEWVWKAICDKLRRP